MKRFELGTRLACLALVALVAGCSGGGGGSSKDKADRDIRVAPVSGPVSEAGAEQSFSIVLNAKPKSDVTIQLASSDESEGTVSPASITFTKDNWDAPQTVLVTGVDDAVADGNVIFEVTLTPESSDGGYEGLEPDPVSVLNLDDETAGVRVGPVAGVTSEFGDPVVIPVVLQSEPTADVVLIFGTSDLTEGTTDVQTLTFTPVNWNAPQNITVTGVDDEIPDGVINYSILFQNAFSDDPGYANLPIPAVALGNVDNDTPGIIVSPLTAATREGDVSTPSVALEVRLSTPPSAMVTLDFQSSDTGEADIQDDDGVGTTTTLELVYNTTNWNVPQTVFLIGEDDSVADGDQSYQLEITDVTSTDPAYEAVVRPVVNLVNLDDDSPGILVSPLSGLGDETGGMMSFTIELQTQPTDDVTIPMAVSDDSEATISHASHTFTTSTWDNPVTVWVAGKEDGLIDGNQPWFVQFSPAVSNDPIYAGRKPANLSGFTLDDGPTRTAIVYDDAMGTEADDALADRGWLIDFVSTPAELESAVDAMTADLVIVESSMGTLPSSTEASLAAWVTTNNGLLILSHWDLDSNATLTTALDVAVTPYSGHRFVFPEPIELIDLFRVQEDIPFPLTGQSMVADGQELVPGASGVLGGRVDSFSGPGAIAATRGDRVIVNGFAPDDMALTDNDGDGLSDMRELYDNEVAFLLKSPSPATFGTRVPVGIDEESTSSFATSEIRVFGVPRVVSEIEVSMHIQHEDNPEMQIFLVGPNGVRLELTTDEGTGDDFGEGCRDGDGRVVFDDDASDTNIGAGPAVGSYQPEGAGGLAVFDGMDPNGTWTLEVADDSLTTDFGTIKCWSLHLTF